MKTYCCELLLSFLLAFLTNALLGAAAASDPVLDIEGKKVQITDYYYIEMPSGGLIMPAGLFRGGNETCPLDVAKVLPEFGFPARFSPVNSSGGVVPEHTDLNIIFYFSPQPQCADHSSVWKVQYDEEYFVRIGGVEGNPGCETITNWFKIEKDGDYYKLVFCPNVCNNHYGNAICKDVGRDSEGRFVLSDTPQRVVFRKFELLKSKINYQY